jgi:hypothetical protein
MKVQRSWNNPQFQQGCKMNQMLFLCEHKEGVQHTYIHIDEM